MARSRRRRRPRSSRPLVASIADRTGWNPEPITARPRPQLRSVSIDRRTRSVIKALEAMPLLAAELGMRVIAQPDGQVEVLPGSPTTIVFSAGGQACGVLVLPIDGARVCKPLHLPPPKQRDRTADRMFEEQRFDDHLCALP